MIKQRIITCAAIASSVVVGTATAAAYSIVYAAVIGRIVAASIAVTNIVVATHIAAAGMTIERVAASCCDLLQIDPSASSMLSAGPKSSFSFPSSAYGYQNKAYCGTL